MAHGGRADREATPSLGAVRRPGLLLAAASALALACGSPPGPAAVHAAELTAEGAVIRVSSTAPWAASPTLPQDVARIVGVSLAYWGGSANHLDGWQVSIEDGLVECWAIRNANGCSDASTRRSRISTAAYLDADTKEPYQARCPEQTVLIHEIGHIVIGDPRHEDPRWRDFRGPERALLPHAREHGCDGLDLLVWES